METLSTEKERSDESKRNKQNKNRKTLFVLYFSELEAVSYFATKYATSLIDDTVKVERLIL